MDKSYRVTYHEETDGTMILRYSGDVQNLVDNCAEEARIQRTNPRPISAAHSNFRKTMSLDPVVMMTIAHEHGIPYSDVDAIFRVARGRDYSRFRCVDDKLLFKDRSRKIIGA